MKHYIIIILVLIACTACKSKDPVSSKPEITVSIPPLKYIVTRLTGDDFEINTIVPNGTSPETYAINPKQSASIEKSELIFITGLFELEKSILNNKQQNERVIALGDGINYISDEHHNHGTSKHNDEDGGIDPHIWLSTEELCIITQNTVDALINMYPDSIKYKSNAYNLINELHELHVDIKSKIDKSGTKAFMIYHPALSYFAREFSLEQISVENEGKEPSATILAKSMNKAKEYGIKHVLYQNEFPDDVATLIAKDIDADAVRINPLSDDIINEITFITNVITR